MHLLRTTLFQNEISIVYCLICLCFSADCGNSFTQKLSDGYLFSFVFLIGDELLTRFESIFMFSTPREMIRNVDMDLWKDCYQGQREGPDRAFVKVVLVEKRQQLFHR